MDRRLAEQEFAQTALGTSDQPFLTLCLSGCLRQVERCSPLAGAHLQHAIRALAGEARLGLDGYAAAATTPTALAAYLEFLIPEVALRSPSASSSIRSAVNLLRRTPSAPDVRIH